MPLIVLGAPPGSVVQRQRLADPMRHLRPRPATASLDLHPVTASLHQDLAIEIQKI
jgi:hypothetical protein